MGLRSPYKNIFQSILTSKDDPRAERVNPCRIFRHLKLELLSQFPASNDEKYYYLWKIDMSNIKLLDQLSNY